MEKITEEIASQLDKFYGKDCVVALATVDNEIPYARQVNAYYEDGKYYIITYALSTKMKHIENNPTVAIAGEWFTAHGQAVNLGWFCKPENAVIAQKLRKIFSSWIDNGHNDFNDENTIILCIQLTDAVFWGLDGCHELNFAV